jgi:hypothetical protein
VADLKLGPSGSQTTLPDVIWPSGSAPEFPYEQDGLVDEAPSLDGSIRVNIKTYAPGTWTIVWDGILWSDVDTILDVVTLKQQLAYTNEYTDNATHNVVVTSFSYSLKGDTAATTARYLFTLTLREVV